MVGAKWCTHHGCPHDVSDFGPSKQHADGLKPICRAGLSERGKAYYERNAEAKRAYQAAYGRRTGWKQHRDPDVLRRRNRLRQARMRLRRKGGGPIEIEYAEALLRDPCSYCGGPATSIDHVEACDSGGSGTWENLTAACGSCNSRKRTTPLLLFMVAS